MEASQVNGGSRRQSTTPEKNMKNGRRQSTTPDSTGRRSSESSSQNGSTCNVHNPVNNRRDSNYRRDSKTPPVFSRKTSESLGLSNGGSRKGSLEKNVSRKPSNELSASELSERRMSEAGLRRPSTGDDILNENTENLMVGMTVWVDGTKRGRIAYLGEVHFAKGDMAGVHLDKSTGKNNGTVGGVMYFQCEPKRGVFSRLHRLTNQPLQNDYY